MEIMNRVNAQLAKENQASLFVTMILGLVDTTTGGMVYGQGGIIPRSVYRQRASRSMSPPGGMPLGVFEDAKFGERELQLAPGESLVVYTDGVTEAMNEAKDLFGEDRLEQADVGGGRVFF